MIRPDDPIGPWWLERQRDPASPDFLPGTGRVNTTQRSWTRLGTLACAEQAVVDPRGLVTSTDRGWSLDWWVGADDRWHLPSREVGVRQHLVGGTPIVETLMRIPGGDAVHRAFAVQGPDGPVVVVEIENASAIPFAVALAVRPYHPLGDTDIESIALEGTTVVVDGAAALLLPKAPARAAGATAATGEVAHLVTTGQAGDALDQPVRCPDGRAQAAFIFPLPHTATLRVALPMTVASRPRARVRSVPAPRLPEPVPTVEQVARGWDAQADRRCAIEVPDERLGAAFESCRRQLLGSTANGWLAAWPARSFGAVDTAAVSGALGQLGFDVEAAAAVSVLFERQTLDGFVGDADEPWAANGATLQAVGEHWRLRRDVACVESLVGPVAKAAHWLDRHRSGRRGRRAPGSGPSSADLAWAVRGLRDGADAMAGVGQPEVAEDMLGFAEAFLAMLRDREPAATDGLAVGALGVLSPGDPWAESAAEFTRQFALVGAGVFDEVDRAGVDPRRTLQLATHELRRLDGRAEERLGWLLEHASPTWTWPTMIHPRSGGGSAGDGHDGVVSAEFCSFVRRCLIDEVEGTLVLSQLVPQRWLGQSWEVHDAPTAFGSLGFAVRWHGDRPALLWELEPHADSGPIRVTAPGLDPSWSSDQPRGEALLGPVAGAEASSSFG